MENVTDIFKNVPWLQNEVNKAKDSVTEQIRYEAGIGAKQAVMPLILLCLAVSTVAIGIAIFRK